MNKRVYGVIGVKSIMSNWNADFSGFPKTISNGDVFGSDKALKYPMKKMWQDENEKILYIKSLKIDQDKDGIKVRPKSLKERYEEIFGVKNLKDEKDSSVIIKNLFNATDVKNFGATFAEEGNNISITGAVQIGQGFNKYEDTNPEEQNILSPFRVETEKNKPKKGVENDEGTQANATTLGTKIVSDEAHYLYPFVINPLSYKGYIELGVTDGYTEEDYKKFKKAALISATGLNTNSKIGCENELTIFIETKIDMYLPNLSEFVDFIKGEDKNTFNIEKLSELINSVKEKVLSVEIYYNTFKLNIEGSISGAKLYDIFTGKEV